MRGRALRRTSPQLSPRPARRPFAERLRALVEPHDDLVAVPVRKHRDHYLLDGCRAELTGVRSGPRTTRTVAVEDDDPRIVRSTVEALGLWSRSNVSFPRGLAGLTGLDWW